jgi:hypothetical protein
LYKIVRDMPAGERLGLIVGAVIMTMGYGFMVLLLSLAN